MHDRMNFPSRKLLVQEHIPNMLTKLIQWHVLQTIAHCATIIAFFYCQMSKIRYDTFVVVTFILSMKIGCLITLQALKLLTFLTWIEQVDYLLVKCQLTNNIITYIENNDANFNPYYCLLL
jgi:hypothetical protein